MDTPTRPTDTLTIRRLLTASRDRVFAAWLDPVMLPRWMGPAGFRSATVEVDARVGGHFRIVMHGDRDYDHHGEYLEIDPPSKLAFTWISEGTAQLTSRVTVELYERGGQTELVLTHSGLPVSEVRSHTEGWTEIAGRLAAALSAQEVS